MPVALRSSCSRAFVLAVLALTGAVPSVEAQLEHNASLIWMREPGAESCIEEFPSVAASYTTSAICSGVEYVSICFGSVMAPMTLSTSAS